MQTITLKLTRDEADLLGSALLTACDAMKTCEPIWRRYNEMIDRLDAARACPRCGSLDGGNCPECELAPQGEG